jgi:protein-tyrosine-phosphatase
VKIRVLFLCSGNSVQSPIAESLLTAADSEHFEVASAGIEREDMHPFTIEVLKEIGVDLHRKATKSLKDVSNSHFDFVITLCDRARFQCPKFPGAEVVHWQLDNPLTSQDEAKQKRLFQSLRDQIAQRVRLFALVQVRFTEIQTSEIQDRSHGQPDLVHSSASTANTARYRAVP